MNINIYVFFFDMFLLLNENYDNLVKLFIIDNQIYRMIIYEIIIKINKIWLIFIILFLQYKDNIGF